MNDIINNANAYFMRKERKNKFNNSELIILFDNIIESEIEVDVRFYEYEMSVSRDVLMSIRVPLEILSCMVNKKQVYC